MKLLFFFLFPSLLFSWSFTERDLKNFSPEQLEILQVSYLVGSKEDLGLTIAAIAVVENMANLKDNNPNHICGPHQIDIEYASASCEALESNPYYSAKLSLENFMFWEYRTYYNPKKNSQRKVKRTWRDQVRMYCVGYTGDAHGPIYVNKVIKAYKVLKENKQWFMEQRIDTIVVK